MNQLPTPDSRLLPSGTVTFLFTDIENSAPLYQQFPDALPRALTKHHEILQQAIAANHGHVFQIIGDAFCAAFEHASDALRAALDAQRALFHADWGSVGALRVRMGLHTGHAETRGTDYISSLTLVRVQRIMSAGHGGQILLSPTTADLVRGDLPPATTLRDLGVQKLRGLAQPETIYQLVASDLPSEFPPLRVVEAVSAQDPAALIEHLVRGILVGRQPELAQLQQHWHVAQQARAHLVMLSGEPGIGKTRLANELITYAQKDGAVILHGGCYEYEAATPYLPFVEALRDWVHWQSAESLRAYLNGTAPEISKLAPEIESKLGSIAPNPPLPPNEERLRLFDNVTRFLQKLAAAHGLLFFMDDLHWADQGTLNLLHYLLRHLRNDRVLILAAYREAELDRAHPLASALVEWNREHLASRLSLARLSRADTGTLLATLFGQASISDEFVEVLYRETEGNPFFIEEVVKSLIEQGQIYRENGGWGRKQIDELAIPQSVKEAIGRRLNRLSEKSVDVLRTAAALGKIFSFAELAAVSTLPEDELLDALDEACVGQLVRANANDTFAFTHDKIREVLYEEMNPIRRRRLHQRIGEALEQLFQAAPASRVRGDGSIAQVLAYHFSESGDMARALNYSRRAAENATRLFALEEALQYLRRAQEAAEALGDNEARAEIDEAMGDIYSTQGLTPPAVEHYQRALEVVSARERRGALHAKVGRDYAQVGDARGEEFLEMALTELDSRTQRNELALATASLGRYHHYRARHHRALEFLERARVLAEPSDDVSILTYLYSYLAGVYQHLARYDESIEWAMRTVEIGVRKNYPAAIAMGNEFLGEDAMARGRWQEALDYAQRDRELGERHGAQDRVAWANYIEAWTRHGMGELSEAETYARDTIALGDSIGDLRVAIMAQGLLTLVLADSGQFDEARVQGEQALVRSSALNHLFLHSITLQAMGYLHVLQHQWTRALDFLEESARELEPTDNQWMRIQLGPILGEAYWGAGNLEQGLHVVNENIALTRFARSRHWEAWATRVQGQIFTHQELFDDAQRAFDFAITTLQELGSRLELARAYHQRATLWRALGDSERANADAERARELFDECGAALPQDL